MDTSKILKSAGLSDTDPRISAISWELLKEIETDYRSIYSRLADYGASIARLLHPAMGVYAIKTVQKSSERIIVDCIHILTRENAPELTVENYTTLCDSIISVKVLYVFEPDIRQIHEFITKTLNCQEAPLANLFVNDMFGLKDFFSEVNATVTVDERNNTSISYSIESNVFNKPMLVSIKVCNAFIDVWDYIAMRTSDPDSPQSEADPAVRLVGRMSELGTELGAFLYRKVRATKIGPKKGVVSLSKALKDQPVPQTKKIENPQKKMVRSTPKKIQEISHGGTFLEQIEQTSIIDNQEATSLVESSMIESMRKKPFGSRPTFKEIEKTAILHSEEASTITDSDKASSPTQEFLRAAQPSDSQESMEKEIIVKIPPGHGIVDPSDPFFSEDLEGTISLLKSEITDDLEK